MSDHDTKLHHEDLDSYQAAIEFLALSAGLFEAIPRGYAFLTDQLKRASLSIPLNIAEGYGKRSDKDRARFYDIARGSVLMMTAPRYCASSPARASSKLAGVIWPVGQQGDSTVPSCTMNGAMM